MVNITRRAWLAALGLAPVAGGLGADVASTKSNKYNFQSIPPRELIRRLHFPNVELVTHEGKKVRFYDDLIKDKNVVINFMYAHCERICPPVTSNMVRVQKRLHDRIGHDIFIYSITLQPEEDTPKVLKEYAKAHGVGPGWLFLTGKPADIELLRRALRFAYDDPTEDADKSNHIGNLRYGNEPAVRWAACPGQAPADWVATSILGEADGPTWVAGVRARLAAAR